MIEDFKHYDNFKTEEPYYNGYRLLSTLDRFKRKPEIYISTSNRSAGKTMFFNGLRVHKFIQNGSKTLLLFRNKYEATNCADPFFKEIGKVFFEGLDMKCEPYITDTVWKLSIGIKQSDKEVNKTYKCFGYATSLSMAEKLKKCSHLLADVDCILMDEFQSEDGRYLPNEVSKLMSIHDSLARGGGAMSRYLPVILIGNLIDIYNPYYTALGVVDDMQLSCNFYRGNGFVIEQGFNDASAEAHKQSAFHRAFSGVGYGKASEEKEYINTDYNFIDKEVADIGYYICTIRYKDKLFSVRYNNSACFYYVSCSPDPSCLYVEAATVDDVNDRAVFNPSSRFRKVLQDALHQNELKFKNIECKNAAMHFIAKK